MNRRAIGLSVMGLGFAMIVTGIIALGDSTDSEPEASPTSTISIQTTTTTSTPASTIPGPTTSTTAPPASTTTSTGAPAPSIIGFIAEYAAATESGDADFLFDRLLPGLRDAFGPDLCRSWVEREILAISGYTLTGEVSGPTSRTLVVGEAELSTSQYFEGPVSFTFQGQSFDTVAQWVIEDEQVYWIGDCR